MTEARFYVTTCTGWLGPDTTRYGRAPGLTASVIDRAYNCAEVVSFRSEDQGSWGSARRGRRRALAEAERVCAELNAASVDPFGSRKGESRADSDRPEFVGDTPGQDFRHTNGSTLAE